MIIKLSKKTTYQTLIVDNWLKEIRQEKVVIQVLLKIKKNHQNQKIKLKI